jgi:hypothetical protein
VIYRFDAESGRSSRNNKQSSVKNSQAVDLES